MNWLAIVAAAALAFVQSTIWYISFAAQRTALLGVRADAGDARRPPPWKVLAEFAAICSSLRCSRG